MSGIYKITNKISNKCYVGSTIDFKKRWNAHFRDLKNNKHHNVKLQRSYNKYGKDAFSCEILEYISYQKELIIDRENFWINELNSKSNGYNIADASFGDTLSHNPNKVDIINRISEKINDNISKLSKHERIEKWAKYGPDNGMYGKSHTLDARSKISEFHKGNTHRLGKKLTNELTRKKLSDIAKLRTGENNSFYGKTHTDETKKILSQARLGKSPSNMRSVVVNGIVYKNRSHAFAETGIKETTIWHRCNSKNKKYIDTYFVDSPKQQY